MSNDLRSALGADKKGRVQATEYKAVRGPKRRPKKEGHDELIARLAPVGTEITLFLSSGDAITGRLHGSDRFTISVSDVAAPEGAEGNPEEFVTSEDSPVVIFYKHAIEGFKMKVIGDKIDRK